MSVTLGAATIQYLTFTERTLSNGATITYVGGSALAISVSGQAITATINDGTTTNLQIANAVNADATASALVTVAVVSGHNADTPHTCVRVPLAGGVTAAVKASLSNQCLKFTADSAGTTGNSIRLKYTAGATAGSEIVTVSTNDITVQIADGVSTGTQVKAALDGDTGAAALIDVTSSGLSLTSVVGVSGLSAFTNLAGGVDAAAVSLVNQGVTVTSITNNAAQNGKTLTYTTGASHGSEVVSVSSGNVSVQIENGVSTVTEIRTALNLSGPFAALYAATGTASSTPVTVNGATLTGQAATAPTDIPLDVKVIS